MDLSLFVRPGERLTAALWNKLVTAVRACRILPGDGITLRQTPDGTLLSCTLWKTWNHPFKVSFAGTSATINLGLVDGLEPKIKDVPISGIEDKGIAQPKLEFKVPKVDKDGRGWIAIEVTCDEKEWKTKSAEMVQVDNLKSDNALKARHPIAMLRQKKNGEMSCFQVEYFNLQHRADGTTGKPARHFFWVE